MIAYGRRAPIRGTPHGDDCLVCKGNEDIRPARARREPIEGDDCDDTEGPAAGGQPDPIDRERPC